MKIGDRVIYVGNKEGKQMEADKIGLSGVVTHLDGPDAYVSFYSGYRGGAPIFCYHHNLILHKDHYIHQFKAIYEQV